MSEAGFFDEKSRGRVISPPQRQAHRAGRAKTRAERPTAEASKHHQAVVKVIGWSKSVRAARQTAAYITRTKPGDGESLAVTAYSDGGAEIQPDQVQAYLDTWRLQPDAENLSAKARRLNSGERRLLTENTRLDRRQSGHMIFSVPAKAAADAEQVHQAVHETLRDTLGASGVKYLYVIHTDHSARPHAHVLLSTRNDRGEQIRVGPEDLRVIREIYAERARAQGIPLVATAREDRHELVKDIVEGLAPLRARASYVNAKRHSPERSLIVKLTSEQQAAEIDRQMTAKWGRDWRKFQAAEILGSDAPSRLPIVRDEGRIKSALDRGIVRTLEQVAPKPRDNNWLPQQAPTFADRHGAAYERRRAGLPETAPKPPVIILPSLHPKAELVVDRAFSAYEASDGAKQRWLELYAERPRFAVWAVNNRPELFGQVRNPANPPKLTQREAQIPQAWRKAAAELVGAAPLPAPFVAAASVEIASNARRALAAGIVERNREKGHAAIQLANARFGELPGVTTPTQAASPMMPEAQDRKRPSWWTRITGNQDSAPAPSAAMPAAKTDKRPSWWRRGADQPVTEAIPQPAVPLSRETPWTARQPEAPIVPPSPAIGKTGQPLARTIDPKDSKQTRSKPPTRGGPRSRG